MAREKFQTLTEQMFYVLLTLREEGCGTDCSSLTELMMSDRCGFAGQEIMFSSNDRLDHGDKNRGPQAELSHHPRRGTGLG